MPTSFIRSTLPTRPKSSLFCIFPKLNITKRTIMALTPAQRLARYAQFECNANISHLSENEKKALPKLIKVGRLMDQLYLRQAWSGNEEMLEKLEEKGDQLLSELFRIYRGPWAREDDDTPFINGAPSRPQGGNFYPEDMTKDEYYTWIKTLSPEEKKVADSFYSVIRRNHTGELLAIPYNSEYDDILLSASKLLKEAAALMPDPTMQKFLNSRADAFLSNNYLTSEVDWLRISKQSNFEITVGPYEVYTDKILSQRAAFEFYLHARDHHDSKMLEKFESSLKYVEDHLPIPEEYKNKKLVPPPIVVVNQLYAGGDVAVPMTAAYNLPNDEEAIKRAGSKLVLIKNVQEGKFEKILLPIAKLTIDLDQWKYIKSSAFTTHILLHEVCHSNGPHEIVGHPDVTVRSRLQEYHSALEEAKADIAGLYAATLLIESGIIEDITAEEFWVTFLASSFRSIRFGLLEAHGLGQAAQLNHLISTGGVVYSTETERFRVDFDKMNESVRACAREILMLQGDGDKSRVKAFLDEYGYNAPETKKSLETIEKNGIPIDIRPIYPLEKEVDQATLRDLGFKAQNEEGGEYVDMKIV